jgi:hypothetical protein
MRKKLSTLVAVASGAAIVTVAGYALAFSGHGGHHRGSPAMAACMAAAPQSVKSNLRSTFKNSSIKSDRAALSTARQSLAQQILAKNTSLTSYETAVSQAQLKVLQDEDAVAQNVCGQLSPTQLASATTLYTNLQNARQTMHSYVAAAHQASGDQASAE